MKVEISRELLQALHDYLMQKPMLEVEQLVIGVRSLKPIEDIYENEIKGKSIQTSNVENRLSVANEIL